MNTEENHARLSLLLVAATSMCKQSKHAPTSAWANKMRTVGKADVHLARGEASAARHVAWHYRKQLGLFCFPFLSRSKNSHNIAGFYATGVASSKSHPALCEEHKFACDPP